MKDQSKRSSVNQSSLYQTKSKKFTHTIGQYFVHSHYMPKKKQKSSSILSEPDHLKIKFINIKDKVSCFLFQCTNQNIPMSLLLYMESVNQIFQYLKQNPAFIEIIKGEKQTSKTLKINIKIFVCNKQKISSFTAKFIQCSKFQSLQNEKIILVFQQGNRLKQKIKEKRQNLQNLRYRQIELDQQNIKKDQQILILQKQSCQLKKKLLDLQKRQVQKNANQKINQEKSVIISKETFLKSMSQSSLFKHVQTHNGKKNLFLSNLISIKEGKGVGDDDIKQMVFYDWTTIEIISMGGNKITDIGLRNLMKIQWTSVSNLYLFANPITDITCITPQLQSKLQILSVYENNLNLASCQFILKNSWPLLNEIYISFERKINQKCCQLIMKSNFKTFPSLKKFHISQQFGISVDLRTKMQVAANLKNIKLTFGEVNLIDPNCQIY